MTRVVNKITGGEKSQKDARFDLIPPAALWALAEHYGMGILKYAERNWERGYNRWYVSIAVQLEWQPPVRESQADEAVGVDLGVKEEVTLSAGEKFSGPKPLRRLLERLRRRSRQHSRKRKGSHNRRKSALRLARLHQRISNIRRDWTHKLTTALVGHFSMIVVEDLNVRGMQQSGRLSRALIVSLFGEIRRQLEYKCRLYGCRLVLVERWYPSSKRCSVCQCVNAGLALSDRVWTCACGAVHDRDVNAAVNILRFGLASLNSPTGSYPGSHACGRSAVAGQRSRNCGVE
ncbi:MAG: RNA-guided endonuclease TnpB family protein [bacterium JZ-2024 1]